MTARVDPAPATMLDLSDPDVWRVGVPHDELTRLRRTAPIAWNERTDGHAGFWVVTRYADIVQISRDAARFSSRHGVISLDDFDDDQNDARRTLLEIDPPAHTDMRKVTSAHFTPKAVSALEGFVRDVVRATIARALGRDTDDVVSGISKVIPILTLCHLLGVPADRHADLIRWSDALLGSDDPEHVDPALADFPDEERRLLPFGHPVARDVFELGRTLAEHRRRNPIDDVVGALACGYVAGRPLTDREFRNYFTMLVVAGNETTRHTITHSIKAIADHPGEWSRFRAGDIDPNVAADEMLRWATAVHFLRRTATDDCMLGDVRIRAGEKVALYYASANRDETVFDDPFRFRLDRAPNAHVSFGRGGPHFCIGAHLARLQVRILLEELARSVSGVELHSEPDRLRSNHVNGIKHMQARLIPR